MQQNRFIVLDGHALIILKVIKRWHEENNISKLIFDGLSLLIFYR